MTFAAEGKKSLLIHQGIVNKDHETLRFHAVKIAFFNQDREVVAVKEVTVPNKADYTIDVTDVPEYVAVFANFEDQDFVQTRLDAQSYQFFKENMTLFEDDLTRALVLRAFYDSLLSGETSIHDFAQIVCNFITEESKVRIP